MATLIKFPNGGEPRGALERASALARAEHQPLLGRLSAAGVAYLGTRAVARLGVDYRLKMHIRLQNRIFD